MLSLLILKEIKSDYTAISKKIRGYNFENYDPFTEIHDFIPKISVSYLVANPSFPLSRFVKQYWAIENCSQGKMNHTQRIVPNGLTELTFYLGNRPVSLDRDRQLPENAIINGHLRSYFDLEISGSLRMFSVSFLPFGVSAIFNIPAIELYNQNVAVKYLIKDTFSELESRLFESFTFTGKIRIIESFLMRQMQKSKNEYNLNRMVHSIGIINRKKGLITIDDLASSACLSRKQYERTFLDCVGTSPKQFLKTIRFQNTLHEKMKNRQMSLTELAYKCGYYDQSHMINEYKMLSGKTPSQYFGECEPYSDYFI